MTVVDIESSYVGFYSRGCGTWTSDLSTDSGPVRAFADGTHLIGIDIEPGSYRAPAYTERCEWRRLSGFRGPGRGEIARSTTPVVHIEATDAGFISQGCGDWQPWSPTSFEDGDRRVGFDVLPGRYRASGAPEECSWSVSTSEHQRSGSGPGEAVRTSISVPFTVADIDPLDERFTSQGCGTWSEDIAPVATPDESFADGTYIVGLDIEPGRYRAGDPSDSCYWLRLSEFRVLEGWYGSPHIATTLGGWGPTVRGGDFSTIVDIQPGDVGFYSEGCGTWSDDLVPLVEPGQSFSDGTYIVGTEVAPGRYRTRSASDSCYWMRLGDFRGEYGEGSDGHNYRFIVRRRDDTSVVDIDAEDAGFYSRGCGTWSDDLSPVLLPGEAFPDGTYIVGVDIEPGRYRATAPPDAGDSPDEAEECVWVRLYDFGGVGGKYEGLFATAREWEVPIVDIDATDVGFDSRGCGVWSSELTPVVTPGEPFGDGVYLVGIDIEPGRYRAYGPLWACEWARLGGFGGDTTFGYDTSPDIIAYSHEGSRIVDILASDAGFRSSNCGEWRRVASDEE
ncbi:MAG: hypothetical protein F4X80_10665 [Chloroflexi bacterium]|nr:hypothetical protein [Chloroflexota bacterium]MYE33087.1 hypothetical protein [Chloroflexota bacterium]